MDLRTGGRTKLRSVTCPISWKIAQLKAYVSTDCHLAPTLSVNKNGKTLHPDQTVGGCIRANETLTIVLPLPGGVMKLLSRKAKEETDNTAL